MKKLKNQASLASRKPTQSIQYHAEQAAPKPAVQRISNEPDVEFTPQPVVTNKVFQAVLGNAPPPPTPRGSCDRNIVYGSVTKSWTSGGVGGTGALKAAIVATYPVSKNLTTGMTGFVGRTFALYFFDIDNQTRSTIPSYAYVFREKQTIPQPEDGGDFTLKGTVSIISQSGQPMLCVNFDMSGNGPPEADSTPRSIGPIFTLDIPEDTKFAPLEPLATV